MKSSTLVAAAAAAAAATVAATGLPDATKIKCTKANANYCIDDGIILRCDGDAIGTKVRCSDMVAAYPPAGGPATCRQSSMEAGDAVCEKNVRSHI